MSLSSFVFDFDKGGVKGKLLQLSFFSDLSSKSPVDVLSRPGLQPVLPGPFSSALLPWSNLLVLQQLGDVVLLIPCLPFPRGTHSVRSQGQER